MRIIIMFILAFGLFALGAIIHEQDIYKQLTQTGKCNNACWTIEINAPNMKVDK